ncbi:MAG: GNAT family N-acetyltransferase [Mycobacteriales bacterium]
MRLERGDSALLASHIDDLVAVYREAFLDLHEADPVRAAADRRAHMLRHLEHPGLVVALAQDETRPVGFCYTHRGSPGQWWHDIVAARLPSEGVRRWLGCCREVVELHVLPACQGRGIGRALLHAALDGATESTVVLSALDDPESRRGPARRLYAREGFHPILEQFDFPGGSGTPYAILGRVLAERPGLPPRSG